MIQTQLQYLPESIVVIFLGELKDFEGNYNESQNAIRNFRFLLNKMSKLTSQDVPLDVILLS